MERVRWFCAVAAVGLAAVVAGGCGHDDGGDDAHDEKGVGGEHPTKGAEDPAPSEVPVAALRERPWEVVSNKGETYLANVFYAEPSENEQIMPWAIDGRVMIDRLIYPTLGNPNLYVKSDADDELVMVLRLEPDAFAHLDPARAPEGGDSQLSRVSLLEDADDAVAFFLVARSERASAESSSAQVERPGVLRITPTKILENPEPADMPASFRKRHTLRFVFDAAAMASVPPGLYDARFEVRKDGQVYANVFEYQYNAVRVFDDAPEEYTALNVTDTQVSTGAVFSTLTADRLDDFVDGVNAESDPQVARAAFITFNGDLHNGGAPGSVRQRVVATTYADEAKRIVGALKRLRLPIFLTAGNHDGYAAIGHVPALVKTVDAKLGDTLEKVIAQQNNRAWPDYSWSAYSAFLDATASTPGGLHRDVFTGGFTRAVGETFATSFAEVARSDRNVILYDGFYQWQKTYGPLYASWTFGKNRYVTMNSYELRQHRRTGWGMYTVNYGGGVSKPQLEWLDRELARGATAGEDVVVLMHHDPRGGHKGTDYGYYAPMIEFRGMAQSTLNYILDEKLTPLVCKQPDWALSVNDRESCLHDGLQEWMGPDAEFDEEDNTYFLSGIALLERFVRSPHARTLVLGHVHFNALEVLQKGDVLVPNRLSLDASAERETASIEAANPVRRLAWEERLAPARPTRWRFAEASAPSAPSAIDTTLDPRSFTAWRAELDGLLARATPPRMATLSGPPDAPRELAVIRLTCGADLTTQTYGSSAMFGWSVLHVTKQTGTPRINRISYFIHEDPDAFAKVRTIDVDRTRSIPMRGPDNPVDQLFDW